MSRLKMLRWWSGGCKGNTSRHASAASSSCFFLQSPSPRRHKSVARSLPLSSDEALLSDPSIRWLCGVDEAGRGSVLGPLVIATVLLSPQTCRLLRMEGVKDSKALSPARRTYLEGIIRQSALLIRSTQVSAAEIDRNRLQLGRTLNQLQIEHTERLLGELAEQNGLELNRAGLALCMDAVDVNSERYQAHFQGLFPEARVLAQHKAESAFVSVAAASIIAKVERDKAMLQLEKETGLALGSGYPSDPFTLSFLRSFSPSTSFSASSSSSSSKATKAKSQSKRSTKATKEAEQEEEGEEKKKDAKPEENNANKYPSFVRQSWKMKL
ncbi:Ribonuclease HII [Balamuthia mandrillaris]